MSSGQRKRKHPHNKTIIMDGQIVRIRKDGRVMSVLGPYEVNHKKSNKK
jgi:hypothetical protein